MVGSLWLKLMGAFALVIAVGVTVTVVLARQGTATQFSHFMVGDQMISPAELQTVLAAYHEQHGGWDGVDAALDKSVFASAPGGVMGGMMGTWMGGMDGAGMGMFGNRVRVVDQNGVVVADSAGRPSGVLEPSLTAQTWPLTVDGRQVGALVIDGSMMNMPTAQGNELLSAVTQAVLSAALVAALVALVLGGLLLRQITRPLAQLNRASLRIASGDLTVRVPVKGQDEIGQLAETFNQMAGSLQSQESLRRRLVADIAHELRTPLAGIQGTVEALQDGVFDLTPESLEPVHEQVTLLNRLVADLRTLSLVEAGNLTLELTAVDPYQLAQRQIGLFLPQALSQGIELILDGPENSPKILGDEQRLDQVLGNLLGNALRHTPDGGTVTVQIRPHEPAVQIAVIDTGEGISPQDLERVFERLYRPDDSRSRQSGGSGLGLAIARQLVEAHGGRIWAESPPSGQERGSAFYMDIPAYRRKTLSSI